MTWTMGPAPNDVDVWGAADKKRMFSISLMVLAIG